MIDFKPKSNIQFTPTKSGVTKRPDISEYQPERGVTETGFFKPTPKLRTRDVARELMNTLTPGAVGFGQSIGGAIQPFTGAQKALEKSRETTSDLETQVLEAIKEKQAKGEDTTRLKDVLRKTTGKEMSDFEINKAINKTSGQVVGETGEVLLDVILGGTYKGAKTGISTIAKTKTFRSAIPTALKGAGIGYGYDVARGLQGERGEEREGGKAFIPGLGTAIGGGIPLAIPAFQKGGGAISKILRKKSTEVIEKEVSDTVGKIIQGKIKDRPRALKVLEEIDTEGVKTFEELGNRIREKSSATLNQLNKFLDKQVGKYNTKELETITTVKSKIGGKDVKVKQNFVTDSLKQLKELYTKIKDPQKMAEITLLERKLKIQGLTVREINDLAKMYGREFGSKAFSKGTTPHPLTSINAQAYENTRKGLKTTARSKIMGEIPKTLDEKVSGMIGTEKLIAKLEEGVNQLYQKIEKRGLGEKLGRFTFNAIDILTGKSASGFLRAGFIPRGGGLKVMNYIDIENKLQKNLKNLEKLLKVKDDNVFIKGIKEMFGGAMKSGTDKGFAKVPGIQKAEEKIPTIKDVVSGRALPKAKMGLGIEDVSGKFDKDKFFQKQVFKYKTHSDYMKNKFVGFADASRINNLGIKDDGVKWIDDWFGAKGEIPNQSIINQFKKYKPNVEKDLYWGGGSKDFSFSRKTPQSFTSDINVAKEFGSLGRRDNPIIIKLKKVKPEDMVVEIDRLPQQFLEVMKIEFKREKEIMVRDTMDKLSKKYIVQISKDNGKTWIEAIDKVKTPKAVTGKSAIKNVIEKRAGVFEKTKGEILYHGTNQGNIIKNEGFKITEPIHGANVLGKGIYLTPTKGEAINFGKNVIEVKLNPKIKIWDRHPGEMWQLTSKANQKYPDIPVADAVVKIAKEKGYGGIKTIQAGNKGETYISVFNPKDIIIKGGKTGSSDIKNIIKNRAK